MNFNLMQCINMNTKRQKFTQEEDQILLKVVGLRGEGKWNEIASFLKGRTGRQCRDRYFNYLRPGFKNDPWTQEEDNILIEKMQQYGSRWSCVAKYLSGRSQNSIKNRWNFCLRRRFENKSSNTNNVEKTDVTQIKNEPVPFNQLNDVISFWELPEQFMFNDSLESFTSIEF